jgi:transposase
MQHIGIDISKEYFDADLGGKDVRRFANAPKGFRSFIKALPPQAHCVMEATGTYGNNLATTLVEQGIAVSIVNPLRIKKYSEMALRRAKHDKADARLITQYGDSQNPPPWQPPQEYIERLKQLKTAIHSLIKMRGMAENELHAVSYRAVQDTSVIGAYKQTIASHTRNIAKLEAQIEEIIGTECHQLYENILSIPGIGPSAASALIADTDAFTSFSDAKQLPSYLGVCPKITQSGSSNPGKASMCKMGKRSTRATLYMCSWSAIKYNSACKALYQRLCAKGKPPMVALIAVINKLLHQIMAIVRTNTKFIENYQPKTKNILPNGIVA